MSESHGNERLLVNATKRQGRMSDGSWDALLSRMEEQAGARSEWELSCGSRLPRIKKADYMGNQEPQSHYWDIGSPKRADDGLHFETVSNLYGLPYSGSNDDVASPVVRDGGESAMDDPEYLESKERWERLLLPPSQCALHNPDNSDWPRVCELLFKKSPRVLWLYLALLEEPDGLPHLLTDFRDGLFWQRVGERATALSGGKVNLKLKQTRHEALVGGKKYIGLRHWAFGLFRLNDHEWSILTGFCPQCYGVTRPEKFNYRLLAKRYFGWETPVQVITAVRSFMRDFWEEAHGAKIMWGSEKEMRFWVLWGECCHSIKHCSWGSDLERLYGPTWDRFIADELFRVGPPNFKGKETERIGALLDFLDSEAERFDKLVRDGIRNPDREDLKRRDGWES